VYSGKKNQSFHQINGHKIDGIIVTFIDTPDLATPKRNQKLSHAAGRLMARESVPQLIIFVSICIRSHKSCINVEDYLMEKAPLERSHPVAW
jgi:hypothetical protein